MKYQTSKFAGLAAIACFAGGASADIFVVGNHPENLVQALINLGESYTILNSDMPTQPQVDGLGPNDILIWGQDGGTTPPPDMHGFLNSGGRLVLCGGSNWDDWRAWAANYFDLTDTGSGWHTDGDWHKVGNHSAVEFVPDHYTFTENAHTYHMLAFLDSTPNSTILGENDEPNNIACIRDYDNGGSFNYMALDINWRAGDQEFVDNWIKGAIQAGGNNYSLRYNGSCPGSATISWSNAQPNVSQGLVFGANEGSSTIPNSYPCAGTPLGIQGNLRLVRTLSTGNGAGSIQGNVGTAACGGYLQMVQGGNCETTNVVRIQ